MDSQLRTLLQDLYPPAGFALDLDDHDWVRLMREYLIDVACGRDATAEIQALLIIAEDLGYLLPSVVERSTTILQRYRKTIAF